MPQKPRTFTRQIPCYAAFDDRGNPLWATVRPTKADSEAILHQFNPPLDGFHYPYTVQPVFLGSDAGVQPDLNI